MFDAIKNFMDPSKLVNNLVDQMLPGKLGNILGDVAGMATGAMTGNYLGALSSFNDFFTNVSGMGGAGGMGGLGGLMGGMGGFAEMIGSFAGSIGELGSTPSFQGETLDPQGHLAVDGNKITTPGGYTVEAQGNASWTVTSPNGETTHVHGDPHVNEKDGTVWHWDDKNMSFVLPDGTKITGNATGNLGVTTDLNVYYGNERVSVTGVDKKPDTSTVSYDAAVHDKFHEDGSTVFLGGTGDDWFKLGQDGTLREVTGGGGNKPLNLGGPIWFDKAIKDAAQLTGMPFAGDKPVIGQGGQGGEAGGIDLKELLGKLIGLLTGGAGLDQLGQAGEVGQAGGAQGAGGAGGAQGAQGAANDGYLSLQEMQDAEDKDISKMIQDAMAGGDLETAIFALMSKMIKGQEKNIMAQAQKMDDATKGGGQAKQTDTIKLQQAQSTLQRMYETLTNIMKGLHDMRMTAVRNLK